MKILFQKDYDDLLSQIKRAESSANEAHRKLSKMNSEILGKEIQLENLEANLEKKNKTLLLTETELLKIKEQRDKAELEVIELKKKNRMKNSQKGGYIKQINKLTNELKQTKEKLSEKDVIINNFKTELKKHIPKKSVIEYEKGIRK
ncbi:MAG: hypothetical protein IKQ33_01605 [Clostridia bacterium]|nr:hypothetical protein [Clostridia bacterium]